MSSDEEREEPQEEEEEEEIKSEADGEEEDVAGFEPEIEEEKEVAAGACSSGPGIWDFRQGQLPAGCRLAGSSEAASFVQQADKTQVLQLMPGQYLELDASGLGQEPLKEYTLAFDVRLDRLPKQDLAVFQAQGPTAKDLFVNAKIRPSGGVGLWDYQGVRDSWLVPKQWVRVAITIKGNEFISYVGGEKCASIDLKKWGGDLAKFHVDPKGFRAFFGPESEMPGQILVRRIVLRKGRLDDTQMRANAMEDRVYSRWEEQRQKKLLEMRRGLSLRKLFGARAPACWELPAWTAGPGLGSKANIAEALLLMSEALSRALDARDGPMAAVLSGCTHADKQALEEVAATFTRSLPAVQWWAQATKEQPGDPYDGFAVTFVRKFRNALAALGEGEALLVPGGLGGVPMLYIVRKMESGGLWQFAAVGVDPSSGHLPAQSKSSINGPIIEHKTVFTAEVSDDKMLDDLLWGLLTRLYTCPLPPERFYEMLLPWLAGCTWQELAAEAQSNDLISWRPSGRSGAAAIHCVEDAVLFLLRQKSVTPLQCSRAQVAMRAGLMDLAEQDLQCVAALDKSQQKMLRMACERLAVVAATPLADGSKLQEEELKQIRMWIDRFLLSVARVPKDDGPFPVRPPAPLDISGKNTEGCWQMPFIDRLLRPDDINKYAGPPIARPSYVPPDFLKVKNRCETFEQARDALRYCDRLSTLLMVQEPLIVNATFLRVELIEHTLTQVVPLPLAPDGPHADKCIWANYKYLYAQQLDMLILLHRLQDHFAAAALSIMSTRAFDAVMLVVPGCIAAIADCVVRQMPADIPSEVCTHIANVGVHPGCFGPTSETIEVHSPTVNIARTAVLDYFTALDKLTPIFQWEDGNMLADQPGLGAFLSGLCGELAFPGDPMGYALEGLMTINYPEWRCYRDIVFWFKYFANPSAKFPPMQPYQQGQATLKWNIVPTQRGPKFQVVAFEMELSAKPEFDELTGALQRNRYPSTATPTFYMDKDLLISIWEQSGKGKFPPELTEDDVLHIRSLPDFDGAIGQRDCELLLSYLTVPYLRLPLVLLFFATKDRVHSLRCPELRGILDSVLFEPGRHLPVTLTAEPSTVPVCADTTEVELLATPYGQLLNEIHWSPKTVVDGVIQLLRLVLDMDTGTVHEPSVMDIVLFGVRVAARVDSYLSFALDHWKGRHESVWWPLRESTPTADTIATVEAGLRDLRQLLRGPATRMLEAWSEEALDEVAQLLNKDDLKVEQNTQMVCNIYAHLLIMHRNTTTEEMSSEIASLVLCSYVFLTTRHQWNRELLTVPETEVYEVLQLQRRRLTDWLMAAESQDLNDVLNAGVRVATATGKRRVAPGEQVLQRRWAPRPGPRGRFTLERELASGRPATLIDAQTVQLSLSDQKLFNLRSEMAQDQDVLYLFGQVVMQASTIQSAQNREWVRLMGRQHELQWWKTPDERHPPCDEAINREYSPGELAGSEQWMVPIFEPIRLKYFNMIPGMPPVPPFTFYLHEDPLAADTQAILLFGKRFNPQIGVWEFVECVVMRSLPGVHAYKLVSQGRRWYRTLYYASDVRHALRDMEPQEIGPSYERLPAMDKKGPIMAMDGTGVTIWRDWDHASNLSGGQEQFIPRRLLYGILPCALLDAYDFWQDEGDDLRGYSGHHVLLVKLENVAVEATRVPGTCGRICRRAAAEVESQHLALLRIQQAIEDLGCPKEPEEDPDPDADVPKSAQFRRYVAVKAAVAAMAVSPEALLSTLEKLDKPQASMQAALEAAATSAAASPGKTIKAARTLEDQELILMNVAYAQLQTPMSSLASCLVRMQRHSYILAWTKDVSAGGSLDLVELPRVKLTFQSRSIRLDSGELAEPRLYSLDYAGQFVTNDRDELCTGLPTVEDNPDLGLVTPHTPDQYLKAASVAKQGEKVTLTWFTASWCGFCTKMRPHIARLRRDYPDVSFLKVDTDELPEPFEEAAGEDERVGLPFWVLTKGMKVESRFAGADPSKLRASLATLAGPGTKDEAVAETAPTLEPEYEPLIAGLPHALVMSNTHELSLLMPALPPLHIDTGPFGTDVLICEAAKKWLAKVPQPSYLYPVHVSLTFLQLPTLAMALYLLLMRFLHRDYAGGFRLAESIATDKEYTGEEAQILDQMKEAEEYKDPDASALRLKISMVTLDSPVQVPWNNLQELYRYISQLSRVTSACRLTDEEESLLLDKYGILDPRHPLVLAEEIPYQVVRVLANRRRFLAAQKEGLDQMTAWLPVRRPDLTLEAALFKQAGSALLPFGPPASDLMLCQPKNQTNAHALPSEGEGIAAICSAGVAPLENGGFSEHVFNIPASTNYSSPSMLPELVDLETQPPPSVLMWSPSPKSPGSPKEQFATYLSSQASGAIVAVLVCQPKCPICARAYPVVLQLSMEYQKVTWACAFWNPSWLNAEEPTDQQFFAETFCAPSVPTAIFYKDGLVVASCDCPADLFAMREKVSEVTLALAPAEAAHQETDATTAGTTEDETSPVETGESESPAQDTSKDGPNLPAAHWNGLQVKYVRSRKLRGVDMLKLAVGFLASGDSTGGSSMKKGFLFFYELITGTADAKLLRNSNNDLLASIASVMMTDNAHPTVLSMALRQLVRAPATIRESLPKYVDRRKNKQSAPEDIFGTPTEEHPVSPLDTLFNALWPQLKDLSRSVKPPLVPVAPVPPAFSVTVPKPAPFPRLFASNYLCQRLTVANDDLERTGSAGLVKQPLKHLELDKKLEAESSGGALVDPKMPFDISKHPQATSVPAKNLIARLKDDMVKYADMANSGKSLHLMSLLQAGAEACVALGASTAIAEAVAQVRSVIKDLEVAREADKVVVERQLKRVVATANEATGPDVESFLLKRFGREELFANAEFAFAVQLSSLSDPDQRKVNPFMTNESLAAVQLIAILVILHGNRISQANQCIDIGRDILGLLAKAQRRADGEVDASLDADVLKAGLVQKSQALAERLSAERHYMTQAAESNTWQFDPRFLVFEFTSGFLMRKQQVKIITDFFSAVHDEKSSMVKQMIMGAGKTTVVAPLLSLMLADGEALLVSIVPPSLLEFSRSVMRAVFSVVTQKRVYSLAYERTSRADEDLEAKLDRARRSGGVVISAPASVKSMMLQMIESLITATSENMPPEERVKCVPLMKRLCGITKMFRSGVTLIDEVDLVLHPLKSELNFPIGPKVALDFSPERWELPMHLIDALLSADGRPAIGFEESAAAQTILEDLTKELAEGYSQNALQRSPHLVLLNVEWYHSNLKPIVARWAELWLSKQHIENLSSADVAKYVEIGGRRVANVEEAPENAGLFERCKNLEWKHMQMLNLTHLWLEEYLPHCMAKIDRVSFGVMSKEDIARALQNEPRMPRSRQMLAIPFVGKDTPARASEFAHPDVVIGLSILGYRYEGLRFSDFDHVIQTLKETLSNEFGPWELRESSMQHRKWVEKAGGNVRKTVLDESTLGNVDARRAYFKELESRENEVVALRMLKRSNEKQMGRLYGLWQNLPQPIHWYLVSYIFPEFMVHQTVKLSASGQELGGSILFPRRVGFSGTPSDLIPREFGKCQYEEGSDGKMMYYMTTPKICSLEDMPEKWSPLGIIKSIAIREPPHQLHALIDTGALVTGYSNLGVARALFAEGMGKWCEGIVFIDEDGRQRILMRDTMRVMSLAQSGVPLEKRFAFYDQYHTTGMDIKHTLSATAALTLGKDMVFRDYSQGAWRMRQIGVGQKIHLLLTPEVKELIGRELLKAESKPAATQDLPGRLRDITAWLNINSMRFERLQYNMLCIQDIQNLWRRNAFDKVLAGVPKFEVSGGAVVKPELEEKSMQAFSEDIAFKVQGELPKPIDFVGDMERSVEEHSALLNADDYKVAKEIVDELRSTLDAAGTGLDEEKEIQAEKQKEQEQEQEQEQEVEIEKFVDLKYKREDEAPKPWPLTSLRSLESATQFYAMEDFCLFKRKPIAFPSYLRVSNNYFDKQWDGERRVKNTVMALEWVPETSSPRHKLLPPRVLELSAEQDKSLERAIELLDTSASGGLAASEFCDMVNEALGLKAEVEDVQGLFAALEKNGVAETKSGALRVGAKGVKSLLTAGQLVPEESGRHWVVLSLAEAETMRRVLHIRARLRKPLLDASSAAVALRCVPSADLVLDASFRMPPTPAFQQQLAWQCHRFLDCEMYYTETELGALLHALPLTAPRRREIFYGDVIKMRRRAQRRWKEAPVAQFFTVPDEWSLLKQKAWQSRVRQAVRETGFGLYDAFRFFDSDGNGVLSAAELFGALVWLGLPDVTARDILEFMWLADTNHDENVDYSEFVNLLQTDEDGELQEGEKSKPLPEGMEHTEPIGAEELEVVRTQMRTEAAQFDDEERKEKELEKLQMEREISRHEKEEAQRLGNPRAEWVGPFGSAYYHITFDFARGQSMPKVTMYGDATWKPNHLYLEPLAHVFLDADLRAALPCQPVEEGATSGSEKPPLSREPSGSQPPLLSRELSGATPFLHPPLLTRAISNMTGDSSSTGSPASPPTLTRQTSRPAGNAGSTRKRLNQYTLTFEVRMPKLPQEQTPLMTTVHACDDVGTVYISSDGLLGACGSYGNFGPKLKVWTWHAISLVVDLCASGGDRLVGYIDGELAFMGGQHEEAAKDLVKDGRFSLGQRFCVFGGGEDQKDTQLHRGIRHVELHTTALRANQVHQRHREINVESKYQEMCEQLDIMIVEDFIARIQAVLPMPREDVILAMFRSRSYRDPFPDENSVHLKLLGVE